MLKKTILWIIFIFSVIGFISSFLEIIMYIFFQSRSVPPGLLLFGIIFWGLILQWLQKKLEIKNLWQRK